MEDPPTIDEKANQTLMEVQVFAEVEEDGRHYRVGGTVQRGDAVSLSDGPTTALLAIAHEERDTHLGNVLGDLRIGGSDLTRFEFYAAPFHIELAEDLREHLKASWRGRPPR